MKSKVSAFSFQKFLIIKQIFFSESSLIRNENNSLLKVIKNNTLGMKIKRFLKRRKITVNNLMIFLFFNKQ